MSSLLSAAEMKIVLEGMVGRVSLPADHRSAEAIDHDMRQEQRAEDRKAARRGDYDSDRTQAWLAERCERAWER